MGFRQLCRVLNLLIIGMVNNMFVESRNTDVEDTAAYEEIQPVSYKRKKRKGKKEADLSNF